MTGSNIGGLRYRAFISYCHRDRTHCARLHRRLESFRLPRGLRVGSDGSALPSRLGPVFRDRDELASAERLSSSLQTALDESAALIVVCSPAAVASPWVNQEIHYFRTRHPQRPVLAFVVAGDPGLDPRADPDQAAFPLQLLLEDPMLPDGALGEPIAADARGEGDGFAAAFLKLVAGLLGLRYDQLRQRELRRRQRRWIAAFAASAALSIVFAALALEATLARDAAQRAQARAELELESERQTRGFLLSVFELADASEDRGNSATVREVLDRAVERIDDTEFSRPAIRSRYLATLGAAYSSLGMNRRSVELLAGSLEALPMSNQDPEAAQQRVESTIELADVLFDMGEYERSLEYLDQVEPAASPAELRAWHANVRGDVLAYLERDTEAEAAYREALELVQRNGGKPDPATAAQRVRSGAGLAQLAFFAGRTAQSETLHEDLVAVSRAQLGERHPTTLVVTVSYGASAYRNGNVGLARRIWTDVYPVAEEVFGKDSPTLGNLANNLGRLHLELGELAAAEPLLRTALRSDRLHRSDTFDDLAYSLNNLALLRMAQDDPVEAEALLREALPIAESAQHPMLGPILAGLAQLQCAAGDAEAGQALSSRALEVDHGLHGADHWQSQGAVLTHNYCRWAAGSAFDRAAVERAMAVLSGRWGSQSAFVWIARRQHRAMAAGRP